MEIQLALFLEPAEADELLNNLIGVRGYMVNKLRQKLLEILEMKK